MRLSGSAVPRALACPASLVYPVARFAVAGFTTEGVDYHAEMETAADVGDHAALPERVQRLILAGDTLATECAFAYDVATDTARELGHVARQYGELAPFEIPGTVDLVVRGSGRYVVIDYKGHERVTPAERNAQLATYALMVARTYGVDEVTVGICYRSDGFLDLATLGPLELDAHAARLKRLAADLVRAAARPAEFTSTGAHCKYCPAFLSCPKQGALAGEIERGLVPMQVEALIPLASDEDAARAYALSQQVGQLQARLKAALIQRAKDRPIPLGGGKVYGERTKEGRRQVDADVAYSVIRQLHGQDAADKAVTRAASQVGIERAVGKAEKKAVMAAIEARGGVTRDARTVVEEYEVE